MNKKMSFTGNGAASILMVFVILCFTVLAILSLLSARTDARLAGKVKEAALQHYTAHEKVAEKLAELDGILINAKSSLDNIKSTSEMEADYKNAVIDAFYENGNFFAIDESEIYFIVDINSYSKLNITVKLLPVKETLRFEIDSIYTQVQQTNEEESSLHYHPGFD